MSPAEALGRAALGAMRRGDRERATELLDRADSWGEDLAAVHEARGILALIDREWETAERSFRAALAAGRFSSMAYTGLGMALAEQGLGEHARTSFRYALAVPAAGSCPWTRRAELELAKASRGENLAGRRRRLSLVSSIRQAG